MFKIIQGTLPSNIDEEELREMQAYAARRRKIEAEVRRQMGEEVDYEPADFIQALMSFPKIDCDDSIFDRHASNGDSDVSG
ncbi:hypothetical protein CBA19CS11_02195 [Caballeronia novacaledonica]|uniref:hypothetical protein n=1 Tax=Caballeronia novacaledonica TaxID=1544861 RepID=UPI001EE2C25A|nr:hypothetical protein [Caballeronia novacaledonica]GJH07599.1 hypothetical protein CBA19CS11_02195 [Caballeronia novacaledonica]